MKGKAKHRYFSAIALALLCFLLAIAIPSPPLALAIAHYPSDEIPGTQNVTFPALPNPSSAENTQPSSPNNSNPLFGAIDFHVHSAPDIINRSIDDFELAQMAANAGMKAIVLKNHVTTTADRAVLASKIVPNIEIFGGIVLNQPVGGINPDAVEAMTKLGGDRAKIVWLPTTDADYHLKVFDKPGPGIKIAENGTLSPQTEGLLKLIAEKHLILETGHISPTEVMLVIDKARQLGIENIVVTHAMADVPGLSLDQMRHCAEMGAILELAFVNELMGENAVAAGHDKWHRVSVAEMAQAIRAIGAQHFILSTDLGRPGDPLPAEGYKRFLEKLLAAGISPREIQIMKRENPARLLGIKS
ncbi:DUF6282 family protein [Phormidium sp. CCY1219]|uniref:DUF6282 family protein n=1 Tax=Phormidium sp. CCY1219 TaxID=2886104 RepID=UPI002D1EFFB9|nr:DUF6282 family protein [Phormidium sp. CCY1219]MEB3829979.1 DUF6282 family protein [Phormidium sp. CCY1219]